ncbi:MAG: D-glycero-beta-D-manno-heptose 1-phosphate adenylyltransferase [Phycisphaeraceae bacterium]|nr:D-glycero-beta-D-manno-heptose 1-phosphate adenylyltransferase [Phycisphaeraceae bacterium]MCW5755239.1 D-glycero-beta-D-manno-heptose 1-phosphate adenylyltransferase [Phycisphaeraceae bacterium]
MDSLLQHLAEWKPFTALVVGDFMLDQLVYGDAERLSADAPVPVLRVRRSENRPGGAANVCHDLIAMKGRVLGFGVVGADEDGRALKETLSGKGIDASGLIVDHDRPTTVKRSLIGLAQQRHPQKMFRVDYESRDPIPTRIIDQIVDSFRIALPRASVVCIEDYNKGVCSAELCQAVIALCRNAGVPVLVDPAAIDDYSRYRSATCITPNRNEAELATSLPTDPGETLGRNAAVSGRLLDTLSLDAVVLTLDRHGALLHQRDCEPLPIPTVARQVYDVTGAGDMMLAGLAAARANQIPWPDAVRFANTAAGLEVEVFGVEPIPLERIHHQLLTERSGTAGKLRTLDQLVIEVAAHRQHGKRIVFTNGCFDVLHSGHVHLIEEAAKHGDFLIVAINDDASVARLKGAGRPVNHQDDRAKVLAALGGVNAVILFSDDTPERLLGALRPDVLVKGGDYTREQVVGGDFVESCGGRVEIVPAVKGRSTTATIAKMRDG